MMELNWEPKVTDGEGWAEASHSLLSNVLEEAGEKIPTGATWGCQATTWWTGRLLNIVRSMINTRRNCRGTPQGSDHSGMEV